MYQALPSLPLLTLDTLLQLMLLSSEYQIQ
uniref:Uncharacterized protein n=1 Tax=virus sp. ctML55 TaxID=2827627 RepID=A0A8S5RIH1_9VIRU|nr:MAG TPA: hypothetical protein [virus sp. ctML55]